MFTELGYRVAVRELEIDGPIHYDGVLLYARPFSDVDHTLSRVRFFLILGVFGGTILALLAGLATAQRAMRPIAELSDARAKSSAPETRAGTSPTRRPTTRSLSLPARSRGCSERSTRHAPTPRRCSTASGSSSPTLRTSYAPR